MKMVADLVLKRILDVLIGAVSGLFIFAAGTITAQVMPVVFPLISKEFLLSIFLLSFLLNVLLLIVAIYFYRKRDFFYRFGLLWRKNGEAYCPACKNLLMNSKESSLNVAKFWCPTCKEVRQPLFEEGSEVSIEHLSKMF